MSRPRRRPKPIGSALGCLLLCAAGFAPPLWAETLPAAPAQPELSALDGLEIIRIVLRRHDIFDTSKPETSAWPYRWANSLHVVTQERFIRSLLLFKEGDPYSAHDAAESARILRALDFLNPVEISAHPAEGGVEVVVETQDRWTLEVGAQAGLWGDRSSYGFEFTEKNFIGWGRQVTVEFESDNERDSWTYILFDPNLLGSRWRGRVQHEDTTHGARDLVRFDLPFYSLASDRSWGVEWERDYDREYLYSAAEIRVRGMRRLDAWRLLGGLRLGGDSTAARRLIVSWVYHRETYSDWTWLEPEQPYPSPERIRVSGPRLEYRRVADRFLVLQGFRQWSKQEDVALGPSFNLGMTVSSPGFGGDRRRVLVDGAYQVATRRDSWLLLGDAWFAGRLDDGDGNDFTVGLQVAAARLGRRGWQARLKVEESHDLDSNRQLTLGADTGLRGWDPDYWDGSGRAVANLQWRTILKEEVAHLFSLGLVLFVDSGYTWDARVGPGTDRVHGDVGVGLLADLTRIGSTNILRCDVALPDDGTGLVVTVTTATLF